MINSIIGPVIAISIILFSLVIYTIFEREIYISNEKQFTNTYLNEKY